ncbi:MAG: D-glycero-alpha-D-manno-heptose-1,7-bisphosphate 7-phosphatase [Paludibacteraceae bacterium]
MTTSFSINNDSALFLDRDGVINRQIVDGYVVGVEGFKFLPGVLSALARLSKKFRYIFIVTNQQGVGKGIFSEKDLENIHQFMTKKIEKNSGRIDKIYVCTALEKENSEYRKPNTGMGRLALNDFPQIDLKTSIMVGDSLTDLIFGSKLGMKTVYVTKGQSYKTEIDMYADRIYTNLAEFSKDL